MHYYYELLVMQNIIYYFLWLDFFEWEEGKKKKSLTKVKHLYSACCKCVCIDGKWVPFSASATSEFEES